MNDQPSSQAWCVICVLAGMRLISASESIAGLATSPSTVSRQSANPPANSR
jgi:hypothetical protein